MLSKIRYCWYNFGLFLLRKARTIAWVYCSAELARDVDEAVGKWIEAKESFRTF